MCENEKKENSFHRDDFRFSLEKYPPLQPSLDGVSGVGGSF